MSMPRGCKTSPTLLVHNLTMTALGQPQEQLELLTPQEVAELLRISRASVYRMVEKRLIRFYKIQSGLRFRKTDVIEYLNQGCIEAVQ